MSTPSPSNPTVKFSLGDISPTTTAPQPTTSPVSMPTAHWTPHLPRGRE